MARDLGRDQLSGDRPLPLQPDLDQLRRVVAHQHGAAQRDLLRRVAADDRVVHVEVGEEREPGLRRPLQRHALASVGLPQPVRVVEHARHEVARHVDHVELAAVEGEQARVRLFQHRHLDAADLRQPLALHRRVRGARVGVGVRGQRRERLVAVIGVRLQHDALAAPPFLQPERAGADGIGHRPAGRVAVSLDHLARNRRGLRGRERVEKRVVGFHELQLQRVAVERAHALDRPVVVEPARGLRLRDGIVDAHEAPAQQERVGRAHLRVDHALHRVHEVVRGQLALGPLERGIVREVDAFADADRPRLAVGGDRGQRLGDARDDLVRAREVVVLVQRLEDRRVDRVRV